MTVHSGKQNTKYREAAERIYGEAVKSVAPDAEPMKVPGYGGVYPTADGAFVEVQVWVPKEALEVSDERATD